MSKTHVVRVGDTLERISTLHYGSPALAPRIYRANSGRIKNPTQLRPGQKLTIPERQ